MLSESAQQLINQYLHLPIQNKDVSCPYYNNRRAKIRGGLRVLIGKGNPEDIATEANIISLREKIDLNNLGNIQIKKILVDNSLGTDCSAFVYHVLNEELKARQKGSLNKYLKFPNIKNPFRKLILKLRTVESTNVKIFAHEENSIKIEINNIQAGDLIIMLSSGPSHDRDHIVLITGVENSIIYYAHSFQWTADGKYNHGVRTGKIKITDINKNLIDQQWIEQEKTNEENETWQHAKLAKILEIRRLKILNS